MMSKMKRDLIRKMKSIKDDKDLIEFLEVYVKLMKDAKNKDDYPSSVAIGGGAGGSVAIGHAFTSCASLTSVNFSSLVSAGKKIP